MACCYNCKKEISPAEKTRLCDGCQKNMLPFLKFVEVSTTSAVNRLKSNERNLRSIGVTDSGIEYLTRLCEIYDKNREKNAEKRKAENDQPEEDPIPHEIPVIHTAADSLPLRESVNENTPEEKHELPRANHAEKRCGKHIQMAEIVLAASGIMSSAFLVYSAVLGEYLVTAVSAVSAISSFASIYVASVVGKMLCDRD